MGSESYRGFITGSRFSLENSSQLPPRSEDNKNSSDLNARLPLTCKLVKTKSLCGLFGSKKANSRPGSVIMRSILSKPKRSQVAIFVIIAIVIVAGIILYFLLQGPESPESPRKA